MSAAAPKLDCPFCNGNGQIYTGAFPNRWERCDECEGTGKVSP
jgi:DnaJ-class molecular chaperone